MVFDGNIGFLVRHDLDWFVRELLQWNLFLYICLYFQIKPDGRYQLCAWCAGSDNPIFLISFWCWTASEKQPVSFVGTALGSGSND